MRVPGRVLALAALLALPAQLWATDKERPDRRSCPADVDAAVAQHCPCDGSMNHGQYVSCVAHYGISLRKAGCRAGTAVRRVRSANGPSVLRVRCDVRKDSHDVAWGQAP